MRGAHEKVVWSGVYVEEEKILREQQKPRRKGEHHHPNTPPALIVVIFRALSPSFTNKPFIFASRLIIIFDKKFYGPSRVSVPRPDKKRTFDYHMINRF